jgi:hypothetical protein
MNSTSWTEKFSRGFPLAIKKRTNRKVLSPQPVALPTLFLVQSSGNDRKGVVKYVLAKQREDNLSYQFR